MNHYYSNTELSNYRRCRRKWWFTHFLRLVPRAQTVSEARETGTVTHSAFNAIYSGTGHDPFEIIAYDIAVLRDQYWDSESDLETIDKVEALSIAIVEGYLQWLEEEGADQGLVVIDSEQEVIARVPNTDNLFLIGKYDLRWFREMDGARVFVDHKIIGNFGDLLSWIHLDTQFKHYHMLERMTRPEEGWSDGGMVNMARRVKRTGNAKPPFYKREEVRHNVYELRQYYTHTIGLIAEIEDLKMRLVREEPGAATQLRPSPMRSCSWECPFFHACPMADDIVNSDLHGYLTSAFTVGDDLDRYSVSHAGDQSS